ncbi:hypothetical protein GCM10019059_10630 [Camelimonas fluminis]|uniref:Big-1 domain-containing protein n=1 Tax=Camelimonas fluminis TaxID=1576911 RepID=A0ABV7UKX9_9HYPH|nr:hypothetical protein [Camelimonas fluminis]GHE53380.1 hypothetical protein GCM10019059_10630 [Camelimonas fluminis]
MSGSDDTQSHGDYALNLKGGAMDVPILNDSGAPNGVMLTATLTRASQPCPGALVVFEIFMPDHKSGVPDDQQARLYPSDSGTDSQTYSALTDRGGKATVTVYDGSAGEVEVIASYTTPTDDSLGPTNTIGFIAPKADKLAVKLDPETTTMASVITVAATATTKTDVPVPGTLIDMTLPLKGQAAFCDSMGTMLTDEFGKPLYKCSVTANRDGVATAHFTSALWSSGNITAGIEDPDQSIDKQERQYTFGYSNDVEAIFDDTVVVDSTGATRLTENSGSSSGSQVAPVAPADGHSRLRISGWVQFRTGPRPLGGNPSVILKASGERASFSNHDLDTPDQITLACQDHVRDGQSYPGYFTAELTSDLPETGHVKVTVDRDVDADGNPLTDPPPAEPATIAYEFRDAWSSVINIAITSANTETSYAIYANGLHQAEIILSFDLVSAAGDDLIPQAACPTVAELAARVLFLDYASGDAIARLTPGAPWPENTAWGFDDVANPYSKKSLGDATPMAVLDAAASTISNGRARLYFYIRHGVATNLDRMTLGVEISPTGCYLDDTVTLQNAPAISYSQAGRTLKAPLLIITPVAPPKLGLGSLSCTGAPTSSDRQNEDGPANDAARSEYKENYYRQIDYVISPSAEFTDTHYITEVTFALQNANALGNDNCYSSITNGLYDYRLYLWPSDALKFTGKTRPGRDGSYGMKSNIDYGATFDPADVDIENAITVTRYIGFGATLHGRYVRTDINLVMTDEYGNAYPICLPADTTPPQYNLTTMSDWNPARPGTGGTNASDTTDSAQSYPVGGAEISYNISSRRPAPSSALASATVADLTFQNVMADTATTSMTINLVGVYNISGSATTISPVFSMSFDNDTACKRAIVYDSAFSGALICAPASWNSSSTTRNVTLRPVWSKEAVLVGVNPGQSSDSSMPATDNGAVTYAALPDSPGNAVLLKAWAKGDASLLWKMGT